MTELPLTVLACGLVLWLALLTTAVVKLRERTGEPVYRRLGNGRVRFSWSVAQAYVDTRRRRADQPRSYRE